MTQITGGCLCGRVRFSAKGAPLRVGICHCMDCRKHHGALFYAAAVFAPQNVTVKGATHAYEGRHFCPTCGGSVFARSGPDIELHLGALDEPNQFRPSYELWCARREDWLPPFPVEESVPRDRALPHSARSC